MGKTISMDFSETPTKSKTPTRNSNMGFNNDNWINFASKAINIQCIDEINNILHAIEMEPKEASEILIFLFKKYQIKSNDILPLLESQQKRLVQLKFEPNFVKKKKKSNKKLESLGKELYVLKLTIPYLDIVKDSPVNVLLVCKKWNQKLASFIYEHYMNFHLMNTNLKTKIWIKVFNPVIFYFHLKNSSFSRTHFRSTIMN